ncbi:MAG: TAXI family TRAP transporter solute-binding subunit [Candidatus Riflebacteria bacterium]|nr:TAXI family TRAP transporter solute-binding subunit [Candidatus Riflebacteria bacterium]
MIRLKKLFVLLFAAAVLCTSLAAQTGSATYKIDRLVTFLAMGTGATTGTYFPLGNAFANVWSTRVEQVSVMSHSTGGSIENIQLMRRRELDLAIAQSDVVAAAINGTGSFLGHPCPNLRVLMSLYPEVVQIVVLADSSIESITDLRGHKVIVGAPGSGNAITSLELMAASGIAKSDFEPVYISYDEALQAMERRDYDAAIVIAGTPTRMISELQLRVPVRILTLTPSETASLTSALPYLAAVNLPAATYHGQDKPVATVALMAMLIASSRLSDDVANSLCRGIFDNLEYLKTIHERARDVSLETIMKGIPPGYAHPGALRFYNSRKQ